MLKAHHEFYALDLSSGWETIPGYPAGIQQKILSGKLDEPARAGIRTRLLRFEPGAFTTQPFETPTKRTQLRELLATFDGIERTLMFSTDYPHWDADDLDFVADRLPSEWHSAVFYENARRVFRWPAHAG